MLVKLIEKNPYDATDKENFIYRTYRLVTQSIQDEREKCIITNYLWLYEETNSLVTPENPCLFASEALKNLMEALRFDKNLDYIKLEILYENDLENSF